MSVYTMVLLILHIRKMIVLLEVAQVRLVLMNYIMIMGHFGIYAYVKTTNSDI